MKDLHIVNDSVIPIGMQIKEQIRWQIATGELKSGDQLPSVREFSDTLGVARNTMIAVYDELRADGLLLVGRGRATEVAESEAVAQLRPIATLLSILDEAFERALAQGFAPTEIRNAAQARAQLFASTALAFSGVTFVDLTLYDFSFFAGLIKQVAEVGVQGVDASHIKNKPALAGEWVVAPCYHAETVRLALRPETELIVLGLRLGMRDLMAMLELQPGRSAVVVGQTAGSAAWVRDEAVREGAPAALQAVGLQDPEVAPILGQAEAVFALPSAYEEVRRMVADSIPVRCLEITLDTGTQERLKAVAGRIAL